MRYRFRDYLIIVKSLTDDQLSFTLCYHSVPVMRWIDSKERLKDLNDIDLRYKYFSNALKGFVIKDSFLMY